MHQKRYRTTLAAMGLGGLAALVTACQPVPVTIPAPVPPAEPPLGTIIQGLAESLIDTGFYEQVSVTGTIGQHYNPGEDSWKVLACFDYAALDGSEGTNCIDSIRAFQLSNEAWIVGVTINEVYRWRAIGLPAGAQSGPSGPVR